MHSGGEHDTQCTFFVEKAMEKKGCSKKEAIDEAIRIFETVPKGTRGGRPCCKKLNKVFWTELEAIGVPNTKGTKKKKSMTVPPTPPLGATNPRSHRRTVNHNIIGSRTRSHGHQYNTGEPSSPNEFMKAFGQLSQEKLLEVRNHGLTPQEILERDQWIEEMREDNERRARTAQEIEMRKHSILFTTGLGYAHPQNYDGMQRPDYGMAGVNNPLYRHSAPPPLFPQNAPPIYTEHCPY